MMDCSLKRDFRRGSLGGINAKAMRLCCLWGRDMQLNVR